MTHKDAMRILDKVKDGVPYPEKIILMALELTGDLCIPEKTQKTQAIESSQSNQKLGNSIETGKQAKTGTSFVPDQNVQNASMAVAQEIESEPTWHK